MIIIGMRYDRGMMRDGLGNGWRLKKEKAWERWLG